MAEPEPVYGSVPEYAPSGTSQDNRIVADVRDLRSIRAELATLGVGVVDLGEIRRLQVAMIGLSGLDAVGGREDAQAVAARLGARYADDGRYSTAPTPLDVVMTLVRDAFAANFRRQPRMGKNRSMEVVGGLPHWAAAELPEPVATDPGLLPRGPVDGPGLRVGVLDTAMSDNRVLAGRFRSDDFVPEKGPHPTWAGHSTFIVGRILQRAPGADVRVRQVLGGRYGTSTAWELAEGMASFLGSGTEVLNLSLGCFTDDDEPPFLLVRAVDALAAEMIVVAAAGNHGRRSYPMPALDEDGKPEWRPEPLSPSSPMWPAAIDGVVAVGAANIGGSGDAVQMTPADFTPVDVPWIQLWAPGVAVVSTYLEGEAVATLWEWNDDGTVSAPKPWHDTFHGWATWSGTSMSAGDVTGEIAGIAQRCNVGAVEAYRMIAERPGGWVGPDDIRPWI